MTNMELVIENRLRGGPRPDLDSVSINVLCLVDHDDKEKRRYHEFKNVSPFDLFETLDHWKHKYPDRLGYYGWEARPTTRQVPRGFDDRLYEKAGEAPWWLAKLGFRENTNFTLTYRSSAAITNAIQSLATASTWLAGYESATYDNTSTNDLDIHLSGVTTVGTTPTVNTRIEHWLVTEIADGTWPDVFDGTTSAETVTSQGVKDGLAFPIVFLNVDATTSDRPYPYIKRSVSRLLDGFPPSKFSVFTTHNTGVNLNATGGNQVLTQKAVYLTGA